MSLDVVELLAQIHDLGRAEDGSYWRFSLTEVDTRLRSWFTTTARSLGLTLTRDANANLVAWWGEPGPGAILTGSHLDSVPGGGELDGPLGVASALAAVSMLQEAGVEPRVPVGVVVWTDEEGGRFDMPCLGSRLASGQLEPTRARELPCRDGGTLAEAWRAAGLDPDELGTSDWAQQAGAMIELHVEQGRALVDMGHPLAVASAVRPHTRRRATFTGVSDHAGTTLLPFRHDPTIPLAQTIVATRRTVAESGDPHAVATIGRTQLEPGGTNVIAGRATCWLDCRTETDEMLTCVVDAITAASQQAAEAEGCQVSWQRESLTPRTEFDASLTARVQKVLEETTGKTPILSTGAGHDAAVLAAEVPTAMVFVRNPTGSSHTPTERATDKDCRAGARGLAAVLKDVMLNGVAAGNSCRTEELGTSHG